MKVTYAVEQTRTAQGVIELDFDAKDEWDEAATDSERRALVERLVVEEMGETGWSFSHQMDFRVEPDEGE